MNIFWFLVQQEFIMQPPTNALFEVLLETSMAWSMDDILLSRLAEILISPIEDFVQKPLYFAFVVWRKFDVA